MKQNDIKISNINRPVQYFNFQPHNSDFSFLRYVCIKGYYM